MSDVNKATSNDNDNKDVCAVKSDIQVITVSNEETVVISPIDGNDETQEESVETPTDDATDLAGVLDEECPEEPEFSGQLPNKSKRHYFTKKTRQTLLANALIKRSIKYLNKMHVMEDVHEGCVTQPSSPGHADQRQAMMEDICKKEPNATSETLTSFVGEIKQEGNAEETPIKQENISENHELTNGDAEALHGTEDSASNDSVQESSLKRKLETEANETPTKRIHVEVQRSFDARDKFLKRCMEHIGGNSFEQLQGTTVQLLTEIRTLNELAKQKEKEWNTILHFKKFKEELLLRLERKKQILLLNLDEFDPEPFENVDGNNKQGNNRNPLSYIERSQAYKQKNFNGRNQSCNNYDIGGPSDYRQNRQRPTIDVKSIIEDYRQKHPETVPRRGRRIRTLAHHSEAKVPGNVMNVSNMALGSGAQVVHNISNSDMNRDLQLLNSMEELRRDQGMDLSGGDMTSFKDMLVQFAKLSQTEKDILRNSAKPPPPPYPEVTVHPVPTTTVSSSLLHGILTKNQPSKPESKSTFSPTLARLLTAPEKTSSQGSMNHNNMTAHANVSTITDILSNSKARNEITITPVLGQFDGVKVKNHVDEEEAEDSVDRLVIDEGGELIDARTKDNNSDAGDEVPQCQGCNQKAAQFVCAGCGNQWYCSRDCQVSAWDEHSEVCSG